MSKVRILCNEDHPHGLVEIDGNAIAARAVSVSIDTDLVPLVTVELAAFDLEVDTHNSEVTTTQDTQWHWA